MAKKKTRSVSKSKNTKKTPAEVEFTDDLIVIDQTKGLIFKNEDELGEYFREPLEWLEDLYDSRREASDYTDDEQVEMEAFLELTLDRPSEIWHLEKSGYEIPFHIFISDFKDFHYVVVAYMSVDEQEPTFVLTHFPTKSQSMVEAFQLGELIFDQNTAKIHAAVLEGDALGDQDPLSVGLYLSMLKVRSEKDIPEADYQKCSVLREETIENPDEIWKKNDSEGNVLVTFIKEYPDFEIKDTTYIVITQEDETSGVNALLFSFPTNDESLVDRYRQGENLEAEEVVQESSH